MGKNPFHLRAYRRVFLRTRSFAHSLLEHEFNWEFTPRGNSGEMNYFGSNTTFYFELALFCSLRIKYILLKHLLLMVASDFVYYISKFAISDNIVLLFKIHQTVILACAFSCLSEHCETILARNFPLDLRLSNEPRFKPIKPIKVSFYLHPNPFSFFLSLPQPEFICLEYALAGSGYDAIHAHKQQTDLFPHRKNLLSPLKIKHKNALVFLKNDILCGNSD